MKNETKRICKKCRADMTDWARIDEFDDIIVWELVESFAGQYWTFRDSEYNHVHWLCGECFDD